MSNTSRNSAGSSAQNSSRNGAQNRTLNRTQNSARNTTRNTNRNSKTSQSTKSSTSTKSARSRNASSDPANKNEKTNNSQSESANLSKAGTSKADEQLATEERNTTKNTTVAVEDIQPLVYSFRVPNNPSPGSLMHAVLPPYWLYHDHIFGVIWMLFHKDRKYVGAAQLHWCLKFLLDLKNTEGEYTGDVNICIQTVQDDLMEQYANLGIALELQESQQGGRGPYDGTDGDYDSTWRSSNLNPGDVNIQESEIDLIENEALAEQGRTNNAEGANLHPNRGPIREGEANPENSWHSLRGDTALWSLRETGGDASRRNNRDSATVYRHLGLRANEVALSLTYNEMASRGLKPYTEQVPLEQIYRAEPCGTKAVPSIPEIIQVFAPDESPQPDADGKGNEDLVIFLDESRRAQIDRIKREVQQLHDLEKFMEGVSKPGFKTYISNDLANRLNKVNSKNVVREVQHALK